MNTAHLYRFVFIIVGLMIFFLVASVSAQTAVLQGTIRDFNDTHIDFENAVGLDPGIVLSLLGNDNLPVYAGLTGTLTTHGQEAFDQWYRDTPGINLPMPYSITLTPTGTPGEVGYSNNAFFPIDNQLFGNQGRPHNYHFTFEIHSSFAYNGGESFTFTGDDDLWVFLNGHLAIDLGGVHGSLSETVSLDANAAEYEIEPGNNYSFDLFFAERHTVSSNFQIETSLALFTMPICDAGGPYQGNSGEPIQFDGSASFDPNGTIVSYDWDFGDGYTGAGATPTHIYAEDGLFTVELCVTDNEDQVSCCNPTPSEVVESESRSWGSIKSIFR